MDGTGDLFARLAALAGSAEIVRYPRDLRLGYDELVYRVSLPHTPHILVGESFSGPVAVRLAAGRPAGLRGLVLAGSFVRTPAPRALRPLVGAWTFRVPPPAWAIRALLAGWDADPALVDDTRRAIASVAPEVLAHRLREILAVDVAGQVPRIDVPILVLSGAHDRLVPPAVVARQLRHLPGARHVRLEAPHLLLQRRPAEALSAIRSHFGGEPATTPA